MINFSPVRFDERSLSEYVSLFSECFPVSTKYSLAYLRWLYCDNPSGKAVGFDAWDGERLAAHYVAVPAEASVGGSVVRVLLSLNTATRPAYQGKGLFTTLADMTYDAGAAQGIDCIYGVANANSTPGFVRKLGFQQIEPLQARVGVGPLGIDAGATARKVQFERMWSAQSLAWRCANPDNPVFSRRRGDLVQLHAPAIGKWLPAYAEIASCRVPDRTTTADMPLPPWRLFIGLVPEEGFKFRGYTSIPQRFRPSPLNLIYRSLSGRLDRLEKGSVSFSFLDFDAY